jgi:O-antigen ligase
VSLRLPRNELWLAAVSALLASALGLLAGIDAKLAVSASLAIAFALLALADLTIGLALFTFLGFIVVVPNFAGDTLSVIKIAALPLLVSWLAVVTREGEGRRTLVAAHPVFSLAMVALLAWVALGYIWAENAAAVQGSVFRYALASILVFVVFTAVRKERDVTMVAVAMVAGAVCAGIYGFLNPPAPEFGQLERLGGTLGNPNELATVLVIGIGLSGGLIAASRNALAKAAGAGAIAICLYAIFLTGSRGGLIALVAMLLSGVLLAKGRRLPLALATVGIVLLGLGYLLTVAPEQSRDRILHPGSGSGRTDIWTVGTRMVAAHPLEGVGGGNFAESSIHYLLRPGALKQDEYIADSPKVAENTYLSVLAELGVPGALIFFSLILFALGCAVRALERFRRSRNARMHALTMAFTVSFIGLLVADFFASKEYARELWLLVGMGPALLAMSAGSDGAPARQAG